MVKILTWCKNQERNYCQSERGTGLMSNSVWCSGWGKDVFPYIRRNITVIYGTLDQFSLYDNETNSRVSKCERTVLHTSARVVRCCMRSPQCVCPSMPPRRQFDVCVFTVLRVSCVSSNPGLQILYNQHSVEVQGHLKKKLITQLQPDTEYSIAPTSRGNIAGGLQQQVSIRTAPDLINTKPITSQPQGGKMTINLTRFQNKALARSVTMNTGYLTQASFHPG